MKPEMEALLRRLLTGERVLSLAVLVEGRPYVGLLPFALDAAAGALLVHASDLARHTRGLGDGAPFSALVHARDDPQVDPLQVPRLTLDGTAASIESGHSDYGPARAAYLRRFPGSERTFELGDFHLYRLAVERGRLVGGFAQAFNLEASAIRALDAGGGEAPKP